MRGNTLHTSIGYNNDDYKLALWQATTMMLFHTGSIKYQATMFHYAKVINSTMSVKFFLWTGFASLTR